MPSYEHKKLIERISQLDKVPKDFAEYANWIKADGHLTLLRENAENDELIIYGSGDYTFIHTSVVSENNLSPLDQDDLLAWSCDPFAPSASFDCEWGSDVVLIKRGIRDANSKTLEGSQPLVFGRNFEGLQGRDGISYEILQEYSHLKEIYWRPEQRAYCSFDENGDFDHIVSITSKETDPDVTLVSFKRQPLEQYLAASNSVLIRMFDFTLLRRGNDFDFTNWPAGPENLIYESANFFYRQKVDTGKAAYSRGVQIIRPSRPKSEIFSLMRECWSGRREKQYVEFVAWDWRNKSIVNISTDPAATTNNFEGHANRLPYELSPVYFQPEVLLKYKADKDKYTIDERHRNIRCRGAWELRSYDINEAGQISAYICDLRNLPYREQIYWKSYNEKPKAGISERAFTTDFKGEPSDTIDPLVNLQSILRQWSESNSTWWKLREEALLKNVSTPRTTNRDEWSRAFMDLSKLIIEGLQIKAIRTSLKEMGIIFSNEEKSLALIEKCLIGHNKIGGKQKLDGLRTVQFIRTKTSAHSVGSEALALAKKALHEHETYTAHFEDICKTVIDELKLIEQTFT